MFYLPQSFEKATKSLLAVLKKKSESASESTIDEYLSKEIGHDKKRVVKKIIDFLKQSYNNAEFEKIKQELP